MIDYPGTWLIIIGTLLFVILGLFIVPDDR